jgi:hypothetical protein
MPATGDDKSGQPIRPTAPPGRSRWSFLGASYWTGLAVISSVVIGIAAIVVPLVLTSGKSSPKPVPAPSSTPATVPVASPTASTSAVASAATPSTSSVPTDGVRSTVITSGAGPTTSSSVGGAVTLFLIPDRGPARDPIHLRASGFLPNELIIASVQGSQVNSFRADTMGQLDSAVIYFPAFYQAYQMPPPPVRVTVSGQESGRIASQMFTFT